MVSRSYYGDTPYKTCYYDIKAWGFKNLVTYSIYPTRTLLCANTYSSDAAIKIVPVLHTIACNCAKHQTDNNYRKHLDCLTFCKALYLLLTDT